VAPYLVNKKDRTFLDDYLLKAELNRYLEPFEYGRLNSVERILLARSIPARLDGIRMDLRDRLALRAPDLTREFLAFEGALSTGGLTLSDRDKLIEEAGEAALGRMFKNANGRPGGVPAPAAAPRIASLPRRAPAPATPPSPAAGARERPSARRPGPGCPDTRTSTTSR